MCRVFACTLGDNVAFRGVYVLVLAFAYASAGAGLCVCLRLCKCCVGCLFTLWGVRVFANMFGWELCVDYLLVVDGHFCCLRAYIGVCVGLGKGDICLFVAALLLFGVFMSLCGRFVVFFGGCLVVRWVIMLLGLVFARMFIAVFGWVLGCVLDLLGLLRGCAAEFLRRYGREESFGDGYRSLFDMRDVGWMFVCVFDLLGVLWACTAGV